MTFSTIALAALIAASAAKEPAPAAAVQSSAPSLSSRGERKLRFRLGLLGGMAMQKTDPELGVAYDFMKLGEKVRLVGDFTLGLRKTEATFEPMVGIRVPFALPKTPKLDLYLLALAGANLTVMRGGTSLALPLRMGVGADYQVAPGLGVGAEFALEVGPLVAPFTDPYGAAHVAAVLAWTP